MKSIKKLKNKLQRINCFEEEVKSYSTIDEISLIQFMKYKYCIRQKTNIIKEINQIERFAKGCNLLYEYDTRRWINDIRIDGKKYCKLEANAKYNRDLKLYKCGVTSKKPVSPFFQKIINYIPNIKFCSYARLKKLDEKLLNFNSVSFPNKMNNSIDACINSNDLNLSEIRAKEYRESLKFDVGNNTDCKSKREINRLKRKVAINYEI